MRLARLTLVAACAASLLAACGDDDTAAPPADDGGCRAAAAGRVGIVAEDLAWDTDCLEVPADAPVVIEIDNRDDGVNHNLRVTEAPGAPKTDLEAGPVVQELQLTLPAGRYEFVCDIHPTMVGTITADGQVEP